MTLFRLTMPICYFAPPHYNADDITPRVTRHIAESHDAYDSRHLRDATCLLFYYTPPRRHHLCARIFFFTPLCSLLYYEERCHTYADADVYARARQQMPRGCHAKDVTMPKMPIKMTRWYASDAMKTRDASMMTLRDDETEMPMTMMRFIYYVTIITPITTSERCAMRHDDDERRRWRERERCRAVYAPRAERRRYEMTRRWAAASRRRNICRRERWAMRVDANMTPLRDDAIIHWNAPIDRWVVMLRYYAEPHWVRDAMTWHTSAMMMSATWWRWARYATRAMSERLR